jgi:hypothetical protein
MIAALGSGDHLPEGNDPGIYTLAASSDASALVESIPARWKKSGLCDPPENPNPKIPHEYEQRRKIGPAEPDGRGGGIAFGHARMRFAIGLLAREARSCVQTHGLRLGSHPPARLP